MLSPVRSLHIHFSNYTLPAIVRAGGIGRQESFGMRPLIDSKSVSQFPRGGVDAGPQERVMWTAGAAIFR